METGSQCTNYEKTYRNYLINAYYLEMALYRSDIFSFYPLSQLLLKAPKVQGLLLFYSAIINHEYYLAGF